jgi:hypothetical protein
MRTTVLNHFHTFHPEAQAEHDRLAREEAQLTLAIARRGEASHDEAPKRRRMSAPPEDLEGQLADLRAQIEEQKAIIASGVVRLHIKGLTRGEYRRLLVEHAPRDGDPLDRQLGYNADTFGDAMIQACLIRTEALDGNPVENRWGEWADGMTNGQWEEVFRACLSLTNDPAPVFPR